MTESLTDRRVPLRRFCVLSGLAAIFGVLMIGTSFAINKGPPAGAMAAQLALFAQRHMPSVLWGSWRAGRSSFAARRSAQPRKRSQPSHERAGPMHARLTLLGWALALALVLGLAHGAGAQTPLRPALKADLDAYLRTRGAAEHISAASASVSLAPGAPTIDVAAGTTAWGGARAVRPSNVFQIGSNTKAFTAAILLQLEAEHRLALTDTVGRWLPRYPAWKGVTITRLLDMTSGIVGYDNVPGMLADYAANPYRTFTAAELVAFAYPADGAPPAAHGWRYSNTAYILAQMIIERVTGHTYAQELRRRLIGADHGLPETWYAASFYPPPIASRMVSGYFHSTDADNAPLAPLLDRDVIPMSLSWTQAAGGIVASPRDVTRWVRRLYGSKVLAPAQRAELMSLVSETDGRSIASTSAAKPKGFGLGVAQATMPAVGTFWYYEGETLGSRMLYAWLPKEDLVIAVALNSQPNAKEDRIGELMTTLLATIRKAGGR